MRSRQYLNIGGDESKNTLPNIWEGEAFTYWNTSFRSSSGIHLK